MQQDRLLGLFPLLVGSSEPMLQLYEQMEFLLHKRGPVLIEGESGSGKELVCRSLHERGPRNASPFLPVLLLAISDSLLEASLFGAAKGSCTGVPAGIRGFFEIAHGGSIALDEVAKIRMEIQSKLLRFMDSGEAHKFGEESPRYFDVRILAMTNRNLAEMVRLGTIREDFYFRLGASRIIVPPLRVRLVDIVEMSSLT